MTRIISALVALFMVATVPFLATGSATASESAASAAKARHDLTVSGKEIGTSNRFIAKGKVTTYKNRKIIVQRKINGKGWKFYKKVKTSASKGAFRTKITAGKRRGDKYCYRVTVPATARYKLTRGQVGCITTF
ncbi:hypothetical protein [Nocardioides sp. SYSU D00038]|uniref:hypothetical protein n=1 Tax=Nocardioides sp. SYSU D00038 TaxID=2812554 RepID=UPI001967C433|nr:hypothetical protein [Nocardioides sp. SYSU D00038]